MTFLYIIIVIEVSLIKSTEGIITIEARLTKNSLEIEVSDSLGLFNSLGLVKNDQTYKSGQNAIVSITDPEGRSRENVELTSNSFI